MEVGARVEGVVTNVVPFGAFVRIHWTIEAFLHVRCLLLPATLEK